MIWDIVGAAAFGFLCGCFLGILTGGKQEIQTNRKLEATIRTLEKQLSTLADHAAALERNFPTSLEGAVGLEGGYDSTLYPKTSAANNPQNDRLRPVPPPPQSQVVEEPQQPSGAEDEKRHEDCY